MKLLQAKLAKYTAPQEAKAAGVYPYFRAISSEQEPEVIINGKKVLMFGSNCYSGLVSDPRIKEAAIEAIKKYGTGCAGSPSSTVLSTCISSSRPVSPSTSAKKM